MSFQCSVCSKIIRSALFVVLGSCTLTSAYAEAASASAYAGICFHDFDPERPREFLEQYADESGRRSPLYWKLSRLLDGFDGEYRIPCDTGVIDVINEGKEQSVSFSRVHYEQGALDLVNEFVNRWRPSEPNPRPHYKSTLTKLNKSTWKVAVDYLVWSSEISGEELVYTSQARPHAEHYFRFADGILWSSRNLEALNAKGLRKLADDLLRLPEEEEGRFVSLLIRPQAIPVTHRKMFVQGWTILLSTQAQPRDDEKQSKSVGRERRMLAMTELISGLSMDIQEIQCEIGKREEDFYVSADLRVKPESRSTEWLRAFLCAPARHKESLVNEADFSASWSFRLPRVEIRGSRFEKPTQSQSTQITGTAAGCFDAENYLWGILWSPNEVVSKTEFRDSLFAIVPEQFTSAGEMNEDQSADENVRWFNHPKGLALLDDIELPSPVSGRPVAEVRVNLSRSVFMPGPDLENTDRRRSEFETAVSVVGKADSNRVTVGVDIDERVLILVLAKIDIAFENWLRSQRR